MLLLSFETEKQEVCIFGNEEKLSDKTALKFVVIWPASILLDHVLSLSSPLLSPPLSSPPPPNHWKL